LHAQVTDLIGIKVFYNCISKCYNYKIIY